MDGISHEDKNGYDEKREAYITNHGYKILKFVGIIPYPDDQIYDYVWSKIREMETSNNPIVIITLE